MFLHFIHCVLPTANVAHEEETVIRLEHIKLLEHSEAMTQVMMELLGYVTFEHLQFQSTHHTTVKITHFSKANILLLIIKFVLLALYIIVVTIIIGRPFEGIF